MKKKRPLGFLLVAALFAACGGNGTDNLIVGTWDVTSITHMSTGHPEQSMNGMTTETYGDGNVAMSMTFRDDGSGRSIFAKKTTDHIVIYGFDSVRNEYNYDSILAAYDTTYFIRDTTAFSYFASGNLLNISEGNLQKSYRIDNIDKRELIYTDTNSYVDTYTNDYGRSLQFVQETKTVYNLRRK